MEIETSYKYPQTVVTPQGTRRTFETDQLRIPAFRSAVRFVLPDYAAPSRMRGIYLDVVRGNHHVDIYFQTLDRKIAIAEYNPFSRRQIRGQFVNANPDQLEGLFGHLIFESFTYPFAGTINGFSAGEINAFDINLPGNDYYRSRNNQLRVVVDPKGDIPVSLLLAKKRRGKAALEQPIANLVVEDARWNVTIAA